MLVGRRYICARRQARVRCCHEDAENRERQAWRKEAAERRGRGWHMMQAPRTRGWMAGMMTAGSGGGTARGVQRRHRHPHIQGRIPKCLGGAYELSCPVPELVVRGGSGGQVEHRRKNCEERMRACVCGATRKVRKYLSQTRPQCATARETQ